MATKELVMDLQYLNNIVVYAFQGEVDSRYLQITIKDLGKTFNLTNMTAEIRAQKPDGTLIYNACTITDATNGIITVLLTSQMSAVKGDLKNSEIWIYQSGGKTLKAKGLTITVLESFDATAIESTSEFTALQTALGQVQDINNKVPNTRKINGYDLTVDRTLTYTDVGGASAAQGAKADSAIQTIKGNGTVITPDANKMVNITPANIGAATLNGWSLIPNTFTYLSSDSPTFTINVSGDLTSQIYAGVKIKLTQSTIKYFIVTAASYASPNTAITLYGGTDYILTSDTISNVYTSIAKAPLGFPLDITKWSVIIYDVNDYLGSSAPNVWWNPKGASIINVPIGAWNVYAKVSHTPYYTGTISFVYSYFTLSTSSNSETNRKFTCTYGGGKDLFVITQESHDLLSVSSKTPLYLLHKHNSDGTVGGYNGIKGSLAPTTIEIISAYL